MYRNVDLEDLDAATRKGLELDKKLEMVKSRHDVVNKDGSTVVATQDVDTRTERTTLREEGRKTSRRIGPLHNKIIDRIRCD